MYVDACLGAAKRCSALDAAVARPKRDIKEGDEVSFMGNVGAVTNLGNNKGEKYTLSLSYLFGVKPSSQSTVLYFYSNH